ncbi:alpha-1,4-N-acetylglucosaminyltransferase [Rhinophrynus dorsalis]
MKALKIFSSLLLITAFGFIYKIIHRQKSNLYIPFLYSSTSISPKDILSQGNGIIFLETTARMKLPSLVLCSIESAARVYHDRPVAFFMKGLSDINTTDENRVRKRYPTLLPFDNVYLFPLIMEELFKDTPLLPWYMKIDPEKELYWVHVSSDGCRLASIWKYGGIYFDTDVISIRPVPDKNFLAAQQSQTSSNGVFGLSPHHDFSWICMNNFVQDYRGEVWGYQGPILFTRVLKQLCNLPDFKAVEDVLCGNISFLNPQRFYPIPYPEWTKYYEVWEKLPTFNDSYALHLWNYMNKGQKFLIPGSNTLVDHLYQQYCPTLYEALKNNKPTFI